MSHDGKRAYCCDIRSVVVVGQRRREDDDDNNQDQRVNETLTESVDIVDGWCGFIFEMLFEL